MYKMIQFSKEGNGAQPVCHAELDVIDDVDLSEKEQFIRLTIDAVVEGHMGI